MSRLETEFPLSGLKPDKRGFSNPYRTPAHERPQMELRMSFSSEMGRICEQSVVSLWAGKIHCPTQTKEQMDHHLKPVVDTIRSYQLLKDKKTAPDPYALIGIHNDDVAKYPKNIDLLALFTQVDSLYGTNFLERYARLPVVSDGLSEGKDTSMLRYLIESAIILAKEVVDPTDIPGKNGLTGNKLVYSGGSKIAQFDAVITKSACDQSWEERVPRDWISAVEIKVPFRTEAILYPGRTPPARNEHQAQMQEKLGKMLLMQSEQGVAHPSLPKYLIYVYLRGSAPHSIYFDKINSIYLSNWLDNHTSKFEQETLPADFDYEKSLSLQMVLTDLIDKRRKKEWRDYRRPKKTRGVQQALAF